MVFRGFRCMRTIRIRTLFSLWLATHADALAMKTAKSLHHYKSYSWGFKGWSQYRLIVVDLSTDQVSCNRQGRDLRKIIDNTIYASKK